MVTETPHIAKEKVYRHPDLTKSLADIGEIMNWSQPSEGSEDFGRREDKVSDDKYAARKLDMGEGFHNGED